MKYEDNKFIQHKIQYTVAQFRVGVEVSREKRPNEQKFKKGGGNLVFVLLCFNYSTIYIYDLVPKGAHARGYALQLKIKHC